LQSAPCRLAPKDPKNAFTDLPSQPKSALALHHKPKIDLFFPFGEAEKSPLFVPPSAEMKN
jgi:hypothetical protein